MFGRWEWIILEVMFLGLLVAELVSVRRSIRRAKRLDAKLLDAKAEGDKRAWGAGLRSPAPRDPEG